MQFLTKNQKLELLLSLIKQENTGNANQLSNRLCVAKPTIEKYLALLREDGYKISYCTQRKTYYFIE